MEVLSNAGRYTPPDPGQDGRYTEELRVPDLSVGTYCLPAGGVDTQRPHTEDEVYVVVSGRARLTADSGTVEVGPGAVVFVPAGEGHRFTDIAEDLTVLVFFGPAEYTRR
ncbi:cupin domain-containing protein [Phytohabitans kaempferiae]|uniref:Cupin domain-containing protein n=1 Tax=Phytohabitans kaempferiae TaxID=1620943 RepID=A0ABV6MH97_9ACTN